MRALRKSASSLISIKDMAEFLSRTTCLQTGQDLLDFTEDYRLRKSASSLITIKDMAEFLSREHRALSLFKPD